MGGVCPHPAETTAVSDQCSWRRMCSISTTFTLLPRFCSFSTNTCRREGGGPQGNPSQMFPDPGMPLNWVQLQHFLSVTHETARGLTITDPSRVRTHYSRWQPWCKLSLLSVLTAEMFFSSKNLLSIHPAAKLSSFLLNIEQVYTFSSVLIG